MALEEKNPTRNIFSGLMIALSGYNFGYNLPIFNSMATPIFCGYFGLPESEKDNIQGNLNFLFCSAAIVGGALLSYVNRNLGRIGTAMFLDLCLLTVSVLFLFDNIWTLMVARVAGGVITGMYTLNSAIILVDLLPKNLSGPCYMVQNMLFGAFLFISFIQQIALTQQELAMNWRLILTWPQLISVSRLLYFVCTFRTETPDSIYERYRQNPLLRAKLKDSFGMVYKDTAALDTHIDKYITEKSGTAIDAPTIAACVEELLTPKYASDTAACLCLSVAEALTGYPFLILFSTVFFDRLGIDGKIASLILGTFNVVGPLVGVFTVNRYPRKATMVVGVVVQAAAFFAMWVCVLLGLVWPVAVSLAVFMISYFVGIGTIHIIYIAEVLPSHAFSLIMPIAWFLWAIVGKASIIYAGYVGESAALVSYALLCVGFAVLLHQVLRDIGLKTQAHELDSAGEPLLR